MDSPHAQASACVRTSRGRRAKNPLRRLVRGVARSLVVAVAVAHGAEAGAQTTADPPRAADDINRPFLDAALDPAEWIAKFEVESREVFTARKQIVAAVGLEAGDRVADVGSGTGLFLSAFSAAVGPGGRVYAVDISPRLVEFVERRVRDENMANVVVVRSTPTSTMLPPGSVTRVFVCDAYHHFERYPDMLASIRDSLVPGGQLVIVDFDRVPAASREWLLTHVRAGKEAVRKEIEDAGFAFAEEVSIAEFKENYLLRFRKPRGGDAAR